jgi:tetratricopeptide (TPR) repeat protein
MAVLRKLLPLLLAVFLFCGCGKPATMKHPLMQKGTQYRNEGNYKLALEFYRNCLKKHPDSPEVILALAELYDENLDQPIPALFYYDEYLKNPPRGADISVARNARSLVYARLGRSFARQSQTAKNLQKETADLQKKNELLNRYIRQLQQQLRAALKRQNTPSKTEKKAKTVKPAARGKR